MSDTTTTDPQTPEATDATTQEPDWKAEAERWKTIADQTEKRAKRHKDEASANAGAVKELDALKQSSMTDIEKAVAQARTEGEANALRKAASKVAAAEIRAAAAGRLDDTRVAALLEGIDLGKFVDDDGEVDTGKVAKFVDGIAPAADETPRAFPDLGQGARGGTGGSADPLLAHVKRLVGSS